MDIEEDDMVTIERYGLALDLGINIAKELVSQGYAQVNVPMHPRAAGMAADASHMIDRLYSAVDFEARFPGNSVKIIPGWDAGDARRYTIMFNFESLPFACSGNEHEYKSKTYIATETMDRSDIAADVVPGDQERAAEPRLTRYISKEIRLECCDPKRIAFSYASPWGLLVDTRYQEFEHVRGDQMKFPVSELQKNIVDKDTWLFFSRPIKYLAWSNFYANAIRKLSGLRYEIRDKPQFREINEKKIDRAASCVPEILEILYSGGDLGKFAKKMSVPFAYRRVYFGSMTKTANWLCNEDSLQDPEKRTYLENLARSCTDAGFAVSAQQLATISKKRWKR